jgi:hypothetical protein
VTPMPLTYTLSAGDLAYIDSFSGLVPCKVLAVEPGPYGTSGTWARVRVTAPRPAYRRGEETAGAVGRSIVARRQVLRVQHSTRIIGETVGIVG